GSVGVVEWVSWADGNRPVAGLVQAPDGFLYGAAALGGPAGLGTVFRMNTRGRAIAIHAFAPPDLGAYPGSSLFWNADGNLYGSTGLYGGHGTLFRMSPTG